MPKVRTSDRRWERLASHRPVQNMPKSPARLATPREKRSRDSFCLRARAEIMINRKLAYIVKDQKPLVLAAHETVQHACRA